MQDKILMKCKCGRESEINAGSGNIWTQRILEYWPDFKIITKHRNGNILAEALCTSCQELK